MFFRGLLLRSLASRLPFGVAVVVQAIVFGLAHANPANGWATLSVVAVTATFGVTQGWFSRQWSLPALMVSHALFNLLPVLIIAGQ
jgi:membrane protease YdiL (CAAX protease family)